MAPPQILRLDGLDTALRLEVDGAPILQTEFGDFDIADHLRSLHLQVTAAVAEIVAESFVPNLAVASCLGRPGLVAVVVFRLRDGGQQEIAVEGGEVNWSIGFDHKDERLLLRFNLKGGTLAFRGGPSA